MAGHKLDPIDRQILAELQADGRYVHIAPTDNAMPHSAQAALLAKICG